MRADTGLRLENHLVSGAGRVDPDEWPGRRVFF